jgi:hypothetical protein
LVIEDRGRGCRAEADEFVPDLLLDLREKRAPLRKKFGERGEAVAEVSRA